MQIAIGLPNPVPGVSGATMLAWAREAEARGFAALTTIGRVAYPNYDSLIALAAAAGVTQRVELITDVLLGPTRDPVLLAKEAASLDQLSGGRFILGAGVGGREDDFTVTHEGFHDRGKRWDAALALMHRIWAGEPPPGTDKAVTPTPAHGQRVPLLIGGQSDAAVERTVRWGIGWTSGGGGPDRVAHMAQRIHAAWQTAGREGSPRIVALCYFALGPHAEAGGATYIRDYYGAAPWAGALSAGLPRDAAALQATVRAFAGSGTDLLTFVPTLGTLDQVSLLADAVLT